MVVWWLSANDAIIAGDWLAEQDAPPYLAKQVEARCGRAGSARLWVDKQFGDVAIDPWPESELAILLEELSYGGIIIREEDVRFAVCGMVTTMGLEIVPRSARAEANERDAERWRKVEKLAMDVNPLGRFHSFGSDVFNLVLEDTP